MSRNALLYRFILLVPTLYRVIPKVPIQMMNRRTHMTYPHSASHPAPPDRELRTFVLVHGGGSRRAVAKRETFAMGPWMGREGSVGRCGMAKKHPNGPHVTVNETVFSALLAGLGPFRSGALDVVTAAGTCTGPDTQSVISNQQSRVLRRGSKTWTRRRASSPRDSCRSFWREISQCGEARARPLGLASSGLVLRQH